MKYQAQTETAPRGHAGSGFAGSLGPSLDSVPGCLPPLSHLSHLLPGELLPAPLPGIWVLPLAAKGLCASCCSRFGVGGGFLVSPETGMGRGAGMSPSLWSGSIAGKLQSGFDR